MGSRLFRFHQLRWLLEWSDASGDPDHDIRATADTVEEARAAMDRILTGVTWTPVDAREFGGDQTEPAYTAVVCEAVRRQSISRARFRPSSSVRCWFRTSRPSRT